MRKAIKELVEIVSETLPIKEPIYEFGSLQTVGQEDFADMRPFFPGLSYIGSDMRKGKGVDIVLDLHKLNLKNKTVGTALALETFEHVEKPWIAIEEIYRVLKSGGMLLITSLMKFPIHNYPYDYWRYTPEAFKSLLKKFNYSYVDFAGQRNFPHSVIGVAFKGKKPDLKKFKSKIVVWKMKWEKDPIHSSFLERFVAYNFPSSMVRFLIEVRNAFEK